MLKAIDFFCGAGGMTHGLLNAGIDVVAGIDCDMTCKPTYEHPENNIRPNGRSPILHVRNVEDVVASEVLDWSESSTLDPTLILVACAPCQFWSRVRTDRGKSSATKSLMEVFAKLVAKIQPGYVLVENVPKVQDSAAEAGLETLRQALKTMGYAPPASGTLLGYQHGVPQKRQRFVLLATRLGDAHSGISLPLATACTEGRYPQGTLVRDFLGIHNNFERLEAGSPRVPSLHFAANLSEKNLARIRRTPLNGDHRSWQNDPSLELRAYLNRAESFRDVYGRMKWDEPAPTITTRFMSLSNGRFGHPEEDRAISLREGATLQTFPRHYRFHGNQEEMCRQIGNAVPPELARRLGEAIISHFRQNWRG